MPLSKSTAPRELAHVRTVECRGYQRADGLWDIEGHIVDTKAYDFETDERGHVAAGEPVHDMSIRLTVDDDLVVQAIEAVTDASPFPEVCPHITPNYQRVVGLKIGRGWRAALNQRLGGVEGCTHLLELLGPIATTAFQTMSKRSRQSGQTSRAPALLNSCHAFRDNGPVVKKYALDYYTGSDRSPIKPEES